MQTKPLLAPSKPHYLILDALRGIAAILVVLFHLFEAHATSHLDQFINHGYLAVDFFFVLSGFVIGYAYDDRWSRMTLRDFFKRRLVRLHPLVVLGMVIGAFCFYFQDSVLWPNISEVPVWQVLLTMVVGSLLIPLPPSLDIRGWNETYPLNGPGWTLFYEYIANILYALVVRKFSTRWLSVLVLLAGVALLHLAVTSPAGDVIGGWSLEPEQLRVGFTRLMYPFFAGMLLFRIGKLASIRNAFLWCSLLLIVALAMPRIGGSEHLWINGLYDAFIIILIFPFIVFLGASGEVKGAFATRLSKFLGDISYPIYITHFPIVLIYFGWVHDNQVPLADGLPVALPLFAFCIAVAYAGLKLYDEPVRRWLTKRFLRKS